MFRFWVLTMDDFSNNIPDWIKDKARGIGIFDTVGMNVFTVIREIQKREGYTQCYKEPYVHCDHTECCWYHNCRL